MRLATRLALAAAIGSFAAIGVTATQSMVPATPSARLGIEMDLQPVDGKAGQFVVSSVVTDLENGAVLAKPRLVVASEKPARIETRVEGKWMLQIAVTADASSRKATYEATFTREGQVVSRQRLALNLNS